MGKLHGRVVNEDGHLLAGVAVRAVEVADGTFALPHERLAELPGSRATRTDEGGRFELDWPAGQPALLVAQAPGFALSEPITATTGTDRDLSLTRGIELQGTVTDANDAPVKGATVRVLVPDVPVALAPWTTTDDTGRYAMAVLPRPGSVVEVLPPDGAPSDWLDLPGTDEPQRRLDIALGPGWAVEGLVRDAETSQPIAGATVVLGTPRADLHTTVSDARGHYQLSGFGGSASRLRASAPGHAPVELSRIPPPSEGAALVDIVLERGRSLSGRLLDPSGTPVGGVRIQAVAARQGPTGRREQREVATSDAEGRFRIDHLSRDLVHALLVSGPGRASSVWDLPAMSREESEHDVGNLILQPATRLAGRVRTPDGQPVVGIEVLLEGSGHDRGALLAEEEVVAVADPVGPRVTRTDAAGRFWFVDVPAGRFRMSTRLQGAAPSDGLTLDVASMSHLEKLDLVLDASAFVGGQVLDPDGRPLAGATVFARVAALDHPEAAAQLAPARVQSDQEGRFSLTGLASGQYTLHVQPQTASDETGHLPVQLADVHTGRDDVVVQIPAGELLGGTLLDSSGAPLVDWVVSATLAEGSTRSTTTHPDGTFELLVPGDTPTTLEVRAAPGSAFLERVLLRREDVIPGPDPLELRVTTPGVR